MTLREFLRLPHRFMWGGSGRPHPSDPETRIYNDCTTLCATWAEVLTGRDPASDLRGKYHDADGASAIVSANGGMTSFFAARLGPLGFVRVADPEDGDIGVIRAPSGIDSAIHEVGAIRFGPLWATLAPSGIAAKKAETVAAWRLVE